jgi:hypothetical protein
MLTLLRRYSARVVSRLFLRTLDAVEDDWELSGTAWGAIQPWLKADPINCEEFRMLFWEHHQEDPAEGEADSIPPPIRVMIRAAIALAGLLGARSTNLTRRTTHEPGARS